LDKKDPENNNEQILNLLKTKFFVEPCRLGENPKDVLPNIVKERYTLPQNGSEKNVLTALVRKIDSEYQNFCHHAGKTYIMERIPAINLLPVKYLLPMVGGSIDGYYEIENMRITEHDGHPALRLRLGLYHHIGDNWIHIYRTKMQPGELISLEQTIKMYQQ